MKVTKQLNVTTATPYANASLCFSDEEYTVIQAVRVIGDNDNATADVGFQLVVSRNSAPLSTGNLLTEDVLNRRDPVIMSGSMVAGGVAVVGRADPDNNILDGEELMDENTYIGVRVTGLETGKVANIEAELDIERLSKTTSRTGEYLSQVVRFQQS